MNRMWWCQSKWHNRLSSTQHCVSSSNKYVIGLRNHSWKILGLEPSLVLKTIITTMPLQDTPRGQTGGGGVSFMWLWWGETVYFNIQMRNWKVKSIATHQPKLILALTGDECPSGRYNRQTCQDPYLISAACQRDFPQLPSRKAQNIYCIGK